MNLLRALGLLMVLACFATPAAIAQDATEEPAAPVDSPAESNAPAAPGREIELGDTVEDTLSPDSQSFIYNFIAQAGDVISITMRSSDVDSYLRLGDARGNPLLSDDDSADDLDARIGPVHLTESGAYVIVASTFDNAVSDGAEIELGDFVLTLTVHTPEMISYPADVEATLEEGEVLHLYAFEATAGDVLSIALNSDDFDPLLVLTDASSINAPALRDDDSGPGNNALIVPFIVPVTGSYFLTTLAYDEDAGGEYVLSVTALEAESIADGDRVEVTIARDELPAAIFSFEAAEGDVVDIIVESATELDTTLTLLGPDGAQVAFNDDSTGRNPALIAQALSEAGIYTLVVQPFTRGFGGDISIQFAQSAGE